MILGNILTLISYIIYWLASFFKSKKTIMWVRLISYIIAVPAYIVLQSKSGTLNMLFTIVRYLLGILLIDKLTNKSAKVSYILVFSLIYAATGVFSFEGFGTMFLIVSNIIGVIALAVGSAQCLRVLNMISSVLFLVYLGTIHNFTGLLCELVTLISFVVTFMLYRKKAKLAHD